jgi:hypothetical protein
MNASLLLLTGCLAGLSSGVMAQTGTPASAAPVPGTTAQAPPTAEPEAARESDRAAATEPPPPITHGGLYVRLHLGPGYARLAGNPKVTGYPNEMVSGAGAAFGVAIGERVTPNVAIFGTLFGVALPAPEHAYEDVGFGSGTVTLTAGGVLGAGVGAARTFASTNVTLSGALAAMASGFMNLDDNEPELGRRATRYGVGVQGIVGKDWRAPGARWGFGMAAEAILAREIEGPPQTAETWTSLAFAVLGSMTYE